MHKLLRKTLVLTGLLGFMVLPIAANAVQPEPYKVICHHNPSQAVTLSFQNVQSYNGHLGTPHNNQTYDTDGPCIDESTSPSPSPSPTETPSPSPSPTISPEPSPTATPEPSPSPSESPSPTPTETPSPSPSPSNTPTASPEPSESPSPVAVVSDNESSDGGLPTSGGSLIPVIIAALVIAGVYYTTTKLIRR